MSGKKDYFISITSSQWEKQKDKIKENRRRAENAEEIARLAREETQRERAESQRRTQELQERFSRENAELHQELRNQERQHNEALNRMDADFNRKLKQQDLSFQEALRVQRGEIEKELRNSHKILQTQIDDINRQMEAEKKSEEQIASFWIKQSQSLLADIDSKYRHRLFVPREWENLKRRLVSAQEDTKRGMNQAALAVARDVCFEAVELQERVIADEWEWTQLFNHANSNLVNVKNRIKGLESLKIPDEDEDGKEIFVPAQIDFWSRGALSEAVKEQQRLEKAISDNVENLSSDDIRSIIGQITALDKTITEVDTLAGDNYCLSQFKRELGDEIAERLPGWNLEEVLYKSEDEREDLHLIFKRINGVDKLSLIVQGKNKGQINVTSDIFIFNKSGESHDEYVQQVKQAIAGTVGYDVKYTADIRYEGQTSGDPKVLDVDEIKRQKQH